MSNTDLTLKQFSKESLLTTKDAWRTAAGEDEFSVECTPIFEWAENHISYIPQADSHAYGVFRNGDAAADAIVEVIETKRGQKGLSKLLRVVVSPSYWEVDKHREMILDIYTDAIFGTIQLAMRKGVSVVKLYGRTDQLMSILESLHSHIQRKPIAGVHAAISGRWLVLTT